MPVSEVHSAIDSDAFLPGAQFADAFSIAVEGTHLTARDAAERMFSRSPWWVDALMRLRDAMVAPFGLKTASAAGQSDVDKVGFFPVLSETPERLVAGFNDHHLDFRVVIDVETAGSGQTVTATTIVLMHNRLGRIYLTAIKPFHQLVVRSMLKQVTRSGNG